MLDFGASVKIYICNPQKHPAEGRPCPTVTTEWGVNKH